MALPKLSEQQDVRRVIHHELGHWLMAREVGFKIGGVCVDTYRGKAAGAATVFPKPSNKLVSAQAVEEYLTNRIMVLCAGVIAEIEWYVKNTLNFKTENVNDVYENGVIDTSGLTDKGRIDELMIILTGIRTEPTAIKTEADQTQRNLFIEVYEETRRIFVGFKDKLFALAKLVENEKWTSVTELTVPNNRLIELDEITTASSMETTR
ncbi:hypothetical protein CRN80_24155 [Pseudomonas sp. FDAARGOS_380]|uniref:hypothetical protein n=1 Tax=unclassified Pseudomonas TaxID=196821 RepID=UPI000BFBFFB9|nr:MULTISPECIES: hypothetical protein [unclassified Pseudomonas]ATN12542.1 hypothetical protein CRN80_24155 [Pseudomonas sp. FDAARGOS_380]NMX26451.1 hypothetical protein [Pseudomonas sp. WS 5406]